MIKNIALKLEGETHCPQLYLGEFPILKYGPIPTDNS